MATIPYKIEYGKICVSVKDTGLFQDIIELLKDAAENDETILPRLAEIMSKHSTEYDYSVESE